MGRAKLTMELISKGKARNTMFKKRKESLLKKAYEFTTLCDVSACIIIYGPTHIDDRPATEPETWPSNADEVGRIVGLYCDKRKQGGVRTFSLSNFFNDRTKKIEEQLKKLIKTNVESTYSTWFDCMDTLSEIQLGELTNILDNKLEVAQIRRKYLETLDLTDTGPGGDSNIHYYYPSIDQTHLVHPINTGSMMTLMMNGDDFMQCSGPSLMPYDFGNPNSMPLMSYYGPTLEPKPPYMQFNNMMMPGVSCEVHDSKVNQYDETAMIDYQMKEGSSYY